MKPKRNTSLRALTALAIVATTLVLTAEPITASVLFQKILYDPIGTETGGEALLLKNYGNTSTDISNWIIATGASATDIILPANVLLAPQQTYLIADTGWQQNKQTTWSAANYETTFTLNNHNSGARLQDTQSNIIDKIGWGNASPDFYFGAPTQEVLEGNMLERAAIKNNNHNDFTSTLADFSDGTTFSINMTITPKPQEIKSIALDARSLGISIEQGKNTAILGDNDATTKNNPTITNTGTQPVTINITATGDLASYATFTYKATLQPGETTPLTITIAVPEDAPTGTFLLQPRVTIQ